jgi:hypothetical protein
MPYTRLISFLLFHQLIAICELVKTVFLNAYVT